MVGVKGLGFRFGVLGFLHRVLVGLRTPVVTGCQKGFSDWALKRVLRLGQFICHSQEHKTYNTCLLRTSPKAKQFTTPSGGLQVCRNVWKRMWWALQSLQGLPPGFLDLCVVAMLCGILLWGWALHAEPMLGLLLLVRASRTPKSSLQAG